MQRYSYASFSNRLHKKAGQVESVLIGGTELGEAEELNLLSHIVIQYHSEQQANNNQVEITSSYKDLTGEYYEDVVSAVQAMGFTNVKSVALDDLSNEIVHKNGDVSEISIGGTKHFSIVHQRNHTEMCGFSLFSAAFGAGEEAPAADEF